MNIFRKEGKFSPLRVVAEKIFALHTIMVEESQFKITLKTTKKSLALWMHKHLYLENTLIYK